MKDAHDDVEAGLIDTDQRGTRARAAFDQQDAEDGNRRAQDAAPPPKPSRRGA